MKRTLWIVSAFAVSFGFVALLSVESVRAIAPFKKEFDLKYVKKQPMSPAEKELADLVSKAKCNVCHGKTKKERNVYGEALDKLLDKKADVKNVKKIREALESVAAQHSKPEDPKSPTFGDLLKEGKLPGGAFVAPVASDEEEEEEGAEAEK